MTYCVVKRQLKFEGNKTRGFLSILVELCEFAFCSLLPCVGKNNCEWRKPLWVRVPQFPVCLTIFYFFLSLCFVCLLSCSGYSTPFSWDVLLSNGLLCIVTFCRGGELKKKKEKKIHPSRQQAVLHCTSFYSPSPRLGDEITLSCLNYTRSKQHIPVERASFGTLAPIILDGWVGWWEAASGGGGDSPSRFPFSSATFLACSW